jgi:hypothetical protein
VQAQSKPLVEIAELSEAISRSTATHEVAKMSIIYTLSLFETKEQDEGVNNS